VPDHLISVLSDICDVSFYASEPGSQYFVNNYELYDWDRKGEAIWVACARLWRCLRVLFCFRRDEDLEDEADILHKIEIDLGENNSKFFKRFVYAFILNLKKQKDLEDTQPITFENVVYVIEKVYPGNFSQYRYLAFQWKYLFELWVACHKVHKYFCLMKKNN
jgi:hypothetical protein